MERNVDEVFCGKPPSGRLFCHRLLGRDSGPNQPQGHQIHASRKAPVGSWVGLGPGSSSSFTGNRRWNLTLYDSRKRQVDERKPSFRFKNLKQDVFSSLIR